MSGAPVNVLHEEASEERGENARLASFVGAIAICDLVKSTLGPKGMDKILISSGAGGGPAGQTSVTNDGATILKSLFLDNAAAKVLVDISKTQDAVVGDGTTSVTVLAGELLREAEKLVSDKIHPQTIIAGWRMAVDEGRKALEKIAANNAADPAQFRKDLVNIAKTTLSSKVLNQNKLKFAELAVDAVLRLKGSTNLEAIQIIKKKGGTLKDSYLDEGFLLNKKIGVGQPKRVENAKVLVANTSMDTDKIKIYGAQVKVSSAQKLSEIEATEREKMKNKVDKILEHKCDVFINRQLIYNYPEQLFADAGVMAIEHADFDGMERLALVLGADIVSTFDSPDQVVLGECRLIEEIMIGEDTLIRFSGVKLGEACTVVLRGPGEQLLDEAERSLHDALCVLSQTVAEPRVVYGAGSTEMLMADAIDNLAKQTAGKKSLAIEAFARALRQLPAIITDNAGFDSADMVSRLRAEHAAGNHTMGIDIRTGGIADMREVGIMESFKAKLMMLMSAAEAAEMILRVDDIVKCAPRRREGQ